MKPKQIKCLELMVQGKLTDKEIAEAINISPKTICEWKKNNEEFHKILFWCSDIAFILSNPDISTAVGKSNSYAKFFLGEMIFLS